MIIAGTGHRPADLPCKYNEIHPWLVGIKENLLTELRVTNVQEVITGGALGWDTWLAEAALECDIPLLVYIPFEGQEKRWPKQSQDRYNSILERAKEVKYLFAEYSNQAFLDRNKMMMDHCDVVYALYNGKPEGGTAHAIRYAESINKPITNFWKEYH